MKPKITIILFFISIYGFSQQTGKGNLPPEFISQTEEMLVSEINKHKKNPISIHLLNKRENHLINRIAFSVNINPQKVDGTYDYETFSVDFAPLLKHNYFAKLCESTKDIDLFLKIDSTATMAKYNVYLLFSDIGGNPES